MIVDPPFPPTTSAACCARRRSTRPRAARARRDRRRRAARRRGRGDRRRSSRSGGARDCRASPTASSAAPGSTSTSCSSSTGVAVAGDIASSSNSADTVHMTPPRCRVAGKLRHVRDIQADDFRFLASVATQDAEGDDPVADDGPLPRRTRGRSTSSRIPDLDEFFDDLAQVLPRRDRRARTPPAAATSSSTTPTSPTCAIRRCAQGAAERGDDPDELPARVRRADQRVHRRPARRSDRRHPPVPRQLPQRVVRRGRLRAGRRGAVQRARTSTRTSSSTTTSARAIRPAALRAGGQDGRARPGHHQAAGARAGRRAAAADRRGRRATCRSSGCASARSAASPARCEGNALTEDEQWAKLAVVVDTAARSGPSPTSLTSEGAAAEPIDVWLAGAPAAVHHELRT